MVTIFWHRVESSNQISLFIADTPYFLRKSKNKLFSDFQIFLFDALLYFSTPLPTLLYLVSHQELHEFAELRVLQKFLTGTRSQNSKTRKLFKIYFQWNYLETSIQRTPGYRGQFLQQTRLTVTEYPAKCASSEFIFCTVTPEFDRERNCFYLW